MNGAATIAAFLLAAVFAWAAIAKAVRYRVTVEAFGALGVWWPAVSAVAVPIGELAVAAVLLVRPEVGAALALAALAAFTLVVVRGVVQGTTAGCGCFGSRRVDPVGPADVIRNGLLAAFAAVATATRRPVAPGAVAWVAMLAAVVAAALVQREAARRLGRGSLGVGAGVRPAGGGSAGGGRSGSDHSRGGGGSGQSRGNRS
jgi:hypothetical protein